MPSTVAPILAAALALATATAAAAADRPDKGARLTLVPGTVFEIATQSALPLELRRDGRSATLAEVLERAQAAGMRKGAASLAISVGAADMPGLGDDARGKLAGLDGSGTIRGVSDDDAEFECYCFPPLEFYVCGWF